MATALMVGAVMPTAYAQETVRIANISELSGPGATSGVNWRDGAAMAIEEINAAGGILGKQIELTQYDSQSDAQTSRAMVQKAIDDGAFALLGTVYSGSTIVNMLVAQQAGIPQMTGSEAPKITALGNPYIFRTSFGAQKSMPKIATYLKDEMKVSKVAIAAFTTAFGALSSWPSTWSEQFGPAAGPGASPTRVSVRQVGLLDGSMVELFGGTPDEAKQFDITNQMYDVVILGDVSPAMLTSARPQIVSWR
jgi:hypothetical protein